jgi:ABC-type branched-subunit amino acid transport system ATPase component/ABC-type branched-subunit amino acid transport system permease subunit
MSRGQFFRIFTPSLFLLALSIVGLAVPSYWQYVLALSISAAVIGSALAMVVGYARCITIATGAMLAIGAYSAALATLRLDVPFLLALLIAVFFGGAAGLILAIPGVRFRSHNMAMVTFVFQAVVIIVLRQSKALTGGAEGLQVPSPVVLGFTFSNDAQFLVLCGILSALSVLPIVLLLEGAFGKNLRAVASNENAARAFGIDVNLHLITAFVWSSAIIACAGAVMAPRYRIIDPDSYGILASIFALTYPIVGGMGSIWGGLMGGIVLRALPEVLRPLADYLELIFCVLVVATILFFPGGFASIIPKFFRRKKAEPKESGHSSAHAIVEDMAAIEREIRPQFAMSDRTGALLSITNVSKSYGALKAVADVSFEVPQHKIHGLMGPNGAGKTTLFNMISGLTPSDDGAIVFDGMPLSKMRVESRIGLGMTRTFQHAAVFDRLSCLDNARIGLGRNGVWQSTVRSVQWAVNSKEATAEYKAGMAALDAVGLAARAHDPAGSLSLGDQRRLEIARAIVSQPKIILLDEPVSGVSVEEAENLSNLLRNINRELGTGILIIEHNIGFLVSLCARISVMSDGRIIADDDANVVVNDPHVRRAYFGEQEAVG